MSTQPAEGGDGNIVTDRQLFDHAIEPTPTPSPAPSQSPPSRGPQSPSNTGETTEAPPPSTRPDLQPQPPPSRGQAAEGQQPRNEQGQFAPKQPQQQRQPEDHRVPLRELLDERERRQRIEAEAHEMRQAWTRLQQEQQQPQQPQTIFDAPDEYLNHRVMNPLRQEGFNMMLQMKDGLSREFANTQFGAQAVNAALADMARIRQTPQGDFVFRQIMAAGHPYGELVKWHNQARAQAAIGNDPQAWLRQQQQAWFNDPKVQEAMANHLRQKHQEQLQQGGSGRPPDVSLPPSLSSVPSSSGRGVELGDLSSESLFAHAIK